MSLNSTPSSHRIHIGFFGRTNVGKSSLVNAITSQSLSIVSPEKGTTTDPVQKAMELLPLGPVVIIDTPGLEDDSILGKMREQRAKDVFHSIDIGVLVLDASNIETLHPSEQSILEEFQNRQIPFLICINKQDVLPKKQEIPILSADSPLFSYREQLLWVSAHSGLGISQCKERLAHLAPNALEEHFFIRDFLKPLASAILVIPIDSGAPRGRIILPQQQVLRELLEGGIITTVVRETELQEAIQKTNPKIVITDSQAFHLVAPIVPKEVFLTSFSILMARYKGTLAQAVAGANRIEQLSSGTRILISEGCTHHRQCDDIGTVKLPRWIQEYTGKEFHFEWTSGRDFPTDLSSFQLIVHCGGCMLNDKEMQYRYEQALHSGISITNYGILIAHLRGILDRSIEILKPSLEDREKTL